MSSTGRPPAGACPRCGEHRPTDAGNGLFRCRDCEKVWEPTVLADGGVSNGELTEDGRQAPEGNENALRGFDVELVACERWPVERVPDDHGNAWWHDACVCEEIVCGPGGFGTVEHGTHVEVKSAQYRIDASGGDRRGRWLIRKRAHDRLLDAEGEYVLGVVRPSDGILALEMRPAWWVDELISTWSPATARRSRNSRQVAQIPWGRAFNDGDQINISITAITNEGGETA